MYDSMSLRNICLRVYMTSQTRTISSSSSQILRQLLFCSSTSFVTFLIVLLFHVLIRSPFSILVTVYEPFLQILFDRFTYSFATISNSPLRVLLVTSETVAASIHFLLFFLHVPYHRNSLYPPHNLHQEDGNT
jgi:hypothetical protein